MAPPHHELNEIDWKYRLSPDKGRVAEHLCAFANHPGGGYFAFGIDASGVPVGIIPSDIEETIRQLSNIGREALEPPLQLDHTAANYQGKGLLLVRVAESAVKPVHRRGKTLETTYIRSGGSTRVASRQEVGNMMMHSRSPRWEELHVSVLRTDDELLELLDIEPIANLLIQPPPRSLEETLGFLTGEAFIERHSSGGGYVTNLGAIAAAKRLSSFTDLSRKAARVIVYRGTNKVQGGQETEGVMGYALSFQRLIQFVGRLLPQSEVIEHGLRQSRMMFPDIALREVIANALIHQDFSISGAGPLIEIFTDRVEISNPGTLLPSKRLDRLMGTQPESRNEKLARAFRRYRICEERGSGLVKAATEMERYGLPPIRFEQGSNHFKVTLLGPRSFAQMSIAERLDACYQHAELRYLSGQAMTNKSLRERLNMPDKQRSMVSVLIQDAMDSGLIVSADPENKSRKFAEYVPRWAR